MRGDCDIILLIFEKEVTTMSDNSFSLQAIGFVRSAITNRSEAPKQGYEGAPDVWIEIDNAVLPALEGLAVGDDVILITWFHVSKRNVLQVHPRGDLNNPVTGVFATRSPDRPNPLGLHRVTIRQIQQNKLQVGPLEAIDGTPVVDIKPVLDRSADA
jgi:tRNA-Thr(GGU) m(6)t(6)A37 methyltransferase TsaA